MEGPRILLGEDPILVRSHVSDLRTDEEHEALGKLELLLLVFVMKSAGRVDRLQP